MRGLRPATWAKLRARYENGETIMALCRRYGVSVNAIRRHRDLESWRVTDEAAARMVRSSPTQRQINMVAKERILDIAVQKGVESASPQAVQAVADTIASMLERTLPLAVRTIAFAESTITLAEKLISRAMNDSSEPAPREGWGGYANAVVTTSANAISICRDVAGLKAGQATTQLQNEQKPRIIRHMAMSREQIAARQEAIEKSSQTAHNTKKDKG